MHITRDNTGLLLHELVGFTVPESMLDKMKLQMQSLRSDSLKSMKSGKPKEVLRIQQVRLNYVDWSLMLCCVYPAESGCEKCESLFQESGAIEDDADDRSSTCQEDDEEVRLPFQTMAQRGGKSMPQVRPIFRASKDSGLFSQLS